MKLSIVQPRIERGNISKNAVSIQAMINNALGDLLVLGEYAVTGSLVLERQVNIQQWAAESEIAKARLSVPDGKKLLINSLIVENDKIYNACTMFPSGEIIQIKNHPDVLEMSAGICAGDENPILNFSGKKIAIVICSDLKEMDQRSTAGADFILFIFHFTRSNYKNVMDQLKSVSIARKIPIIAASLVSDKNCGHSCYIDGTTVVSLGEEEGILEVTI